MTFITGIEKSIIKSTKNIKPQVVKAILNKKVQFWRYPTTCFQIILQSYNNKSSMIVAGRDMNRIKDPDYGIDEE
jgi:hypothetical protein